MATNTTNQGLHEQGHDVKPIKNKTSIAFGRRDSHVDSVTGQRDPRVAACVVKREQREEQQHSH